MFSPVPMLRLDIVVLETDERAVLREMGRRAAMHLIRAPAGPDTAPIDPPDRAADIARCDRLLAGARDLRDSLDIPDGVFDIPAPSSRTAEPPPPASGPQAALDAGEARLLAAKKKADPLIARRQELLRQQEDLAASAEQVAVFRGLNIPLDEPDGYSFLHFVTGHLPGENMEQLRRDVGDNVVLLPLPGRKARQPLVALTTRHGRDALEGALQQADFRREAMPAIEGATVEAFLEENSRKRAQAAGEVLKLNGELAALAASAAKPVAEIERLAVAERSLLEAEQHFPRTDATALLTGWVPAPDAPALERRLGQITGGRCAIRETAAEDMAGEEIPVLLRHSRLLRPFEMLIGLYGLPRYRELEPTLFVALSFVLMFGMMFGDAGHGALLAGAGLFALLTGRGAKVRDVGLLLLLGGFSSLCFGVAYGSYFGIPALRKYAFWRDPLEGDPSRLLYIGIGFGVVMITLGLVLNIVNRFRRRDVAGGFLDKFGVIGILFYWGSLALLARHAAIEALGLTRIAVIAFLALPLAVWAFKEPVRYALRRRAGHPPEPGGMGAAAAESLVDAFEAVLSYLANTVSFVRLAAYAMSHAALLMATFVIADQVRHVPAAGGVLSILIAVIGNLVAMALEGIVASVQALRLEYYEFFGKFFSGSGRPFTPFRLADNGQAAQEQREGHAPVLDGVSP